MKIDDSEDPNIKKIVENIYKKKNNFHKMQAKLPIEEKIKILVKLQKIAFDTGRLIDSNKKVWNIWKT